MTRFQKYIKQVEEGDQGFTLIELMVVVLIIGILMAIAIPTFLGAKNSANAKAAQENVRNVYTDEAAAYANNQQYSDTLPSLQAAEANMTVAGTVSTPWTANTVYVQTGSTAAGGSAVQIAALGKDKNCYYLEAIDGTVYYGTTAATGAGSNVCSAPVSGGWDTSWGGSTTTDPATVSPWTAAH